MNPLRETLTVFSSNSNMKVSHEKRGGIKIPNKFFDLVEWLILVALLILSGYFISDVWFKFQKK